MKVYAAGERLAQGTQTLHICPAAHVGERVACPTSWFTDEGEPLQMSVTFVHGVAEVEDSIGRYLLAHRMARKARLIVPEGVNA